MGGNAFFVGKLYRFCHKQNDPDGCAEAPSRAEGEGGCSKSLGWWVRRELQGGFGAQDA